MNKPEGSENLDPDNFDKEIRQHINRGKEVEQKDSSSLKATKLAKQSLIISGLGLGIFAYLHFSGGSNIDEAIAHSKAEIIAEVQKSVAGSQQTQLQTLLEKNAELEIKVDGYAAQISDLEMKVSQILVDLEKNTSLRAKVAELQAVMKKGKTTVAVKPQKIQAPVKKVVKTAKTKKGKK